MEANQGLFRFGRVSDTCPTAPASQPGGATHDHEYQQPPRIEVSEFTICHDDGEDSVVYRANPDEGDKIIGEDHGRLRVRLGIDGMWTTVCAEPGRTSPLTLVERSIAALIEVRDQLALTDFREGRCLTNGDGGRCDNREGHEGDREFPSEADWRSLNRFPSKSEVSA